MLKASDPVITYNHMQEENMVRVKYFKKGMFSKNQTTLLFILEEALIVTFLGAMIYLFLT